ncbi:MAG TPA: hypothetical protein VLB85_02885 [Acidimicrobiia bacterium]|nr:hypothetical protein [Acidimicrobiia bacterium]
MAKRAREHRKDIPGYDDTRPARDDRKRHHRRVRHAANQILAMVDDPDEITLPDVKRHRLDDVYEPPARTGSTRFKVWKTKFWKRRDSYRDMKAEIDSNWPVITSHQLEP